MKVGDVVALSAYGKSLKRTGWIIRSDVGIVVKVLAWAGKNRPPEDCSYVVRWAKSARRPRSWHHQRILERRDLIHAR
jgi:hypothetical protein